MTALSGDSLAAALTAGFHCLQRYRDPLNALNVYPVPDGDTGTNMLLTMRAGVEKLAQLNGATAGEVAAQVADGAFWEARGNSGVILSQFFKGIALGLDGKEVCAGEDLAQAFRSATEAAYRSVGNPVEGTMLTVIRWVAEALESAMEASADNGGADLLTLWETGYSASKAALEATPTMLPKLREAGVVDAGGMGIVVILGGAFLHLTGEDAAAADLGLATAAGQIDPSQLASISVESDFLDSSVESEWGYCTQFLIQGENLDIEKVRSDLAETAESLVIVGDDRFIRVHVHMEDPGVALTYGASLGQLDQIKIDNMSLQNQDWASGHQERGAPKDGITLVAVAPGEGPGPIVPGYGRRFHCERRPDHEPQRCPADQRRRGIGRRERDTASQQQERRHYGGPGGGAGERGPDPARRAYLHGSPGHCRRAGLQFPGRNGAEPAGHEGCR